jgi:hypothetical protein
MPSKVDGHMTKLVSKGFTTGTVMNRLFFYLRSKGGTGSYAAMQRQLRPGGKVSYVFDPDEVP